MNNRLAYRAWYLPSLPTRSLSYSGRRKRTQPHLPTAAESTASSAARAFRHFEAEGPSSMPQPVDCRSRSVREKAGTDQARDTTATKGALVSFFGYIVPRVVTRKGGGS